MRRIVVVIPIHKSNPNSSELASFAQCYEILGKHPIRIIAPEGLDITTYTHVVPECQFVFIDKNWLSSVEQYNKLKIDPYFYHLFKEYNYLLTYELDSWVFRDELNYWCEKGYDFIGAPWFEGYYEGISNGIIGVGNSGFSLRNVKQSIRLLKRIGELKKIRRFWYSSRLQAIYPFEKACTRFPFHLSIKNIGQLPKVLWNYFEFHEDNFWCIIIPSLFEDFKIAPMQEALKFSFEVNPCFLFEQNHYQLPFGCHAWEKYEPGFWKDFISYESKEYKN